MSWIADKWKAMTGRKQRQGTGLEVSRWHTAPPRRGSRELIESYKAMPWLQTIVDTVSDAVACNGWRVVRRVDANKRPVKDYSLRSLPFRQRHQRLKALEEIGQVEEVPSHPLLLLLSDPNDYFTAQQMWGLVQKYMDLVGEAFLAAEFRGPVPVGLWPVPPHAVTRLPDLTKPLAERFYTVQIGGIVREVPASMMLHLRHLDPDDPLGRGIGRAFSLGDELDSDEYIARFTKNSFWNNCIPPFIAGVEGMKESGEAKKFVENIKARHSGPENAGKLLITSGKVSIARLDSSFKDLALVDVRKFLMAFIRMVYRVPPEIVGDVTSSNKATAYAARENLAEQCTVPRLEFLRAFFQKWLLPLFPGGDDAILDYDSPVPADKAFSLRVMGVMPAAFSYDEWRGVAGFKPDPNRQGYPMPLPGQKPEGNQTPEADPTGPAGAANEEQDAKGHGDPPWAAGPLPRTAPI